MCCILVTPRTAAVLCHWSPGVPRPWEHEYWPSQSGRSDTQKPSSSSCHPQATEQTTESLSLSLLLCEMTEALLVTVPLSGYSCTCGPTDAESISCGQESDNLITKMTKSAQIRGTAETHHLLPHIQLPSLPSPHVFLHLGSLWFFPTSHGLFPLGLMDRHTHPSGWFRNEHLTWIGPKKLDSKPPLFLKQLQSSLYSLGLRNTD